jgi:polar amino acid transport system substrate-binding protein
MKRLVSISFVLLSALALIACSTPVRLGAGPTSTRIDQILERGELRVGLSGNQPPLNMKNRSGAVIGLEVDLMRELAGSMGVDVRFVEVPFAELISAVEQNEVDLAISGMTITPERNARVAFAGPYLISGKSLLTKSEDLANAEAAAPFDVPERKFAALAGSTSERFVKDRLSKAELRATPDYDTAVELVLNDEVDALIADFPICAVSVLRYPEAGLLRHRTPFTVEPLGIALPAGDPLLVNLVQNYLRTLDDSGVLTGLKAKWFSPGDWISELP